MNVAYQGVQIQRDLPYVEVPQELLGQAIPPLYDGYRELLMDLTHVPLDSRKRKVTDRIRNCAARILGYLNYLAQNGSHGGIQYSRAQFQHLFRNEYGMETIELAQSLLIVSRLVLPPNQHPSTDRAFCWRLDVLRLQAAFARLAARQKSSDTHSHRHPEHQRPTLSLVTNTHMNGSTCHQEEERDLPEPYDSSHEVKSPHARGENPSSIQGDTSDQQRQSPHAYSEITASTPGNSPVHEVFSPSVYGENAACNKILEKEERQKEIPSSPPLQMGRQEGNPHQQPGETTQRKPLLVAKPPYPSVEQPDSPQLILAFFDWLRGYPLPAELLPRAKAAAQTLFYGNEQTQQPGYSRFQVEQTALYLRDHDPVWKQNYHEWCSRTGIPDVWLVAKHIGSKWPLALRRLLESGDYLQMEDGSLWSKEEYQAYLQREQEVWQQQQQEGEDTSPLISWDTPREQPTNSDPTPSTMTQQENYLPTPDPAGWQELPLAQPQANRLRRAFPAYYHVELQPTENERWAIMIINDCLEDDGAIVTCNQQVCALVDAARQARVSPINWTLPTIAAWWATYLSRRLPSDWQIMADEQAEGCGITITTPQQHTTRLVNDEQVASWLHSLRSSRVKNNQHKSMIRS